MPSCIQSKWTTILLACLVIIVTIKYLYPKKHVEEPLHMIGYQHRPFAFIGNQWGELTRSRQLCLGTHMSIDILDGLPEMVEHWSGPVSVSMFTPGNDRNIAKAFIGYLRQCFPGIRDRVSFHFTNPIGHESTDLPIPFILDNCTNYKGVLRSLLKSIPKADKAKRKDIPFPQNVLRNVAKHSCPSNYSLIVDGDMIPSPGMDLKLEQFFSKTPKCSHCAFVVPIYGVNKTVEKLPATKAELLELSKDKKAVPFHQLTWKIAQLSTDYGKWEALEAQEELEVAYNVSVYHHCYEPLYVAANPVPDFDDRLVGFGVNRFSQAYELYLAGYSFPVLNNVFLCHWGIQRSGKRTKARRRQQNKNSKLLYDKFIPELHRKYPNATSCLNIYKGCPMRNVIEN